MMADKSYKSYVQSKIEEALWAKGGRLDSAVRRTRILASGIQEYSEVGYKAASMAGIARRARVSTATLYREFGDKSALLVACMTYVVTLLTQAITHADVSEDPVKRITHLLINHGTTFGDPFMAWLYRLYAGTTQSALASQLTTVARSGRDSTEAFWRAQLSLLEEQGHIRPHCHATTTNLLLGQVERRTLLAQLLFGSDDQSVPSLEAAARFAAEGLFANLGTQAFANSKWAKPA